MTPLLGYVAFDGAPVPDRIRPVLDYIAVDAGFGLRAPVVKFVGNAVVGVAGNPRLRGASGHAGSLSEELLRAYLDEGAGVLERLRGPFVVAIVEPQRRRALLAIDRMGVERLAWGISGEALAFGTSALEVAKLLSPAPAVDPQALFDFMQNHMIPAPGTAFAGVRKLLPATAMEFTGATARTIRYWEPSFERKANPDVEELRRALLPALRAAVENTRPDAHTGSFLSGGLDSSTVTGLLAGAQPERSKAFSVGFGVPEFDELAYARIAAGHFGCEHHEYEVTPADVVRILPEVAAACDEPFGNSSAVPTLACVELARRNGISHVLAGDGGDELFGGNERYLDQRVFELYAHVPALLRRGIDSVAGRFHPEDSLLPFRKLASYVQQANIRLPERFERWNLVYREGADAIFSPEFLEGVDRRHPLDCMYETWNACPSDDLLDRMLWYDWKFTLADNDLRKVKQMCDIRRMEVSFPMLDEQVVELSLEIPSSVKIERKVLRSYYKAGMRNFLPDEILNKKKHGFGLPFGHWLKSHEDLQDLTYGNIERLEKRGIFRPDFLRKVTAEHRQGHPGYYGYAIWALIAMEQWLQARENDAVSMG